jgi:hypothetical protein
VKYPVITLWQPWAQWVALGWKTIETRTHNKLKSLVGREVLIHCGQNWDFHAMNEARPYLSPFRQTQTANADGDFLAVRFAPGNIIAKAFVAEHRVLTYSSDPGQALIECRTPRFGLIFSHIKLLDRFIPAQGKQGIWYHEA